MSAKSFFGCPTGLVLLLTLFGCGQRGGPAVQAPPIVTVVSPIERDVTDYVDLTGQVSAPESVDMRARVTGYLVAAPYKEGAQVKTGDLLFQIDPRPYQAQLADAEAKVGVAEARLRLATNDSERAKTIKKTNVGAISDQEVDKYQAMQEEAEAALDAAKAELQTCQLNMVFTNVVSPIDGQVSRYYLTPGNLVNQDTSLLTTVVSQDPMYVYFDLDETTMLRIMRFMLGKNEAPRPLAERKIPVMLGLVDEEGYPHAGYVDFAENQVDASTGTLNVRGVFQNPASASGVRLLKPGMFVRVRLPVGQAYKAWLVPDGTLGSDQGSKYLLTVDGNGIVQYLAVKSGALQADGLRVIADGLKGGERVIISGLQIARPRMKVQTEEAEKAAAAAGGAGA